MEAEVEPIINDHWAGESFPRELLPKFRELGLIDAVWNDDGTR
ncbi:MAG: acyl-CoA dehydrogenase, partial [Thiohalospira sp.]